MTKYLVREASIKERISSAFNEMRSLHSEKAGLEEELDHLQERERRLTETLKAVLPLAWRDHKHPNDQRLLEEAERLLSKRGSKEASNG